jgi:hypothetical protein
MIIGIIPARKQHAPADEDRQKEEKVLILPLSHDRYDHGLKTPSSSPLLIV